MIHKITKLIESVNNEYKVMYDESYSMNVKADAFDKDRKFAYIEEFKQGEILLTNHFPKERTRLQIYFFMIKPETMQALEREALRDFIKSDIVRPFVLAFNKSEVFEKVERFQMYTGLPRFDARDIGVTLDFYVSEVMDLCPAKIIKENKGCNQ